MGQSGQVENSGLAKTNKMVTAHFYDSIANNVGDTSNSQRHTSHAQTHQIGVFNIKASQSAMSKPASFVSLEYPEDIRHS